MGTKVVHRVSLKSVKDGQLLVTILGAHQGDFTLRQIAENGKSVDAKSIMGVVTLVSQTPLELIAPINFDKNLLGNLLKVD